MTHDPRARRGAHRTGRDANATLLPSLLAILAVTALITSLYVWRGEDTAPPRAAASSQDKAAASAQATASKSPATTSSPRPATTGSGASVEATTTKTHAPTRTATKPPGPKAAQDIAVVVLNQTSTRGLAAIVGDRLTAKGWKVTGVGNFRGVVPATTVYYPVGRAAEAQAAAESLPTPARIRPRFGNLSSNKLTVVVTTNYPG